MGRKAGKLTKLWQSLHGFGRNTQLPFPELFDHFQKLIGENNQALEIMSDMGEKMGGEFVFDSNYISSTTEGFIESVYRMIYHFDCMAPGKYRSLFTVYNRIRAELESELSGKVVIPEGDFVIGYGGIDDTLETLVGGKNSHLGVIATVLGIRIPKGFAITSRCFAQMFREGECGEKISSIISRWSKDELKTVDASDQLQSLILNQPIPKPIRAAIVKNISLIVARHPSGKAVRFAVRSSGVGEDGEHSYAGQYESILNVLPEAVPATYLEVVASLFSPRAMEYRRMNKIQESEAVMAVGVQAMIPAKVSGVAYSLNAFSPDANEILISSTYGLGADLVGGEQTADQFHVSRTPPYEVHGMEIVHKNMILEGRRSGDGVQNTFVDPRIRDQPSLKINQLREVVDTAMQLESYFRQPQDIEFAFDQNGKLVVLQTRPLNIEKSVPKLTCDFSELEGSKILLDGVGDVVQEGVGMGVIHLVRSEEDLDLTPQGAILVAHFSSPNLARVMKKVNGIITDIGSPIGHLSTIAREFRVPMIINTRQATKLLATGMEVTLDAQDHKVYEGLMPQLCYYEFAEEPFEETYEFRLLRRLLKKITPLQLVDPEGKNFKVGSCRTMHDLIRFVHEKSVDILIGRNYTRDPYLRDHAVKLDLDIPLDLTVIDFDHCQKDNGCNTSSGQNKSVVLKAFTEGMCIPGLWAREPVAVDMKSFMSSMTRTFASNVADPRFVGQNLAVTSAGYMNVSLRLGYHFSLIDCICSDKENENYIYFRFFGGVTDTIRRSRRGKLIQQLLMENEFMVTCKGDLVVGRIRGGLESSILDKIYLLGGLVSFTRQLDVKMIEEASVGQYVDSFQMILQHNRRDGQEEGYAEQ